MAGLVTNFMAAASIATTMHVHQEAGPGLQLLAQSPIPDLVIVSKTDIPQAGDSFLTRIIKNVGLTDAFAKAGVDKSNMSLAIAIAQAAVSPGQQALQHGNAFFIQPEQKALNADIKSPEFLTNPNILEKIIGNAMIFYDPEHSDNYAKLASGMKGATMKYIPGTENDWIAFKLAHEAGHAEGKSELVADRIGYEYYQNAVRSGQNLSLDYLDAIRGMRILFDMNVDPNSTSVDTHAYTGMNNFQWEKGAERFPDALTPKQYKQAVASVQNLLYGEIGLSLETPKNRLDSLDIVFPSFILSDEYKGKIAIEDKQEEQSKIMDQAHLSAEQKILYFDDLKRRRINLGFSAAINQPELVYNAALQMQPQIEKEGNDTEKLFLNRYIEAAERYQPDLFHVQEADRKSNTPITDKGITLSEQQATALPSLKITSP